MPSYRRMRCLALALSLLGCCGCSALRSWNEDVFLQPSDFQQTLSVNIREAQTGDTVYGIDVFAKDGQDNAKSKFGTFLTDSHCAEPTSAAAPPVQAEAGKQTDVPEESTLSVRDDADGKTKTQTETVTKRDGETETVTTTITVFRLNAKNKRDVLRKTVKTTRTRPTAGRAPAPIYKIGDIETTRCARATVKLAVDACVARTYKLDILDSFANYGLYSVAGAAGLATAGTAIAGADATQAAIISGAVTAGTTIAGNLQKAVPTASRTTVVSDLETVAEKYLKIADFAKSDTVEASAGKYAKLYDAVYSACPVSKF